jgi:hypothetical protein
MPFYGNQNTPNRTEWTHNRLVEAARALSAEIGRSPTTQEAVDDDRFPSLATIYRYAEGGWLGVLADAGLEPTQVRGYKSEERPQMCRDLRGAFRVVETPHLTHRQYDDLGTYPTSVVKEQFGSWRQACDAAGIQMGEKHGTRCEGPNGERLDSYLERTVACVLVEYGIEYVAHPLIQGTNWEADFYLPESELWVEVDGYIAGTRPNAQGFEAKLAHLRGKGEDVVVVENPGALVDVLRRRGVVAAA